MRFFCYYALLIVLAINLFIFSVDASTEKQFIVKRQLEMLEKEIYRFAAYNNRLPVNLDEVAGWGKSQLNQSNFTDPWGRQWVYIIPGSNERLFDIYSKGINGVDNLRKDDDYFIGKPLNLENAGKYKVLKWVFLGITFDGPIIVLGIIIVATMRRKKLMRSDC